MNGLLQSRPDGYPARPCKNLAKTVILQWFSRKPKEMSWEDMDFTNIWAPGNEIQVTKTGEKDQKSRKKSGQKNREKILRQNLWKKDDRIWKDFFLGAL